MTEYVPADYWAERGRTYEDEARQRGWWDAEDQPLIELLGRLTFQTVLEVGCGYGRVGAAVSRYWPKVKYSGIDISPDLIAASARRLPKATLICADVVTWDSDRTWDLVLAANTLGHIPPADLPDVWAKMKRWAKRDIVHIDWNDIGNRTAYQYGHDYRALHGSSVETPMGATTMFHTAKP